MHEPRPIAFADVGGASSLDYTYVSCQLNYFVLLLMSKYGHTSGNQAINVKTTAAFSSNDSFSFITNESVVPVKFPKNKQKTLKAS